MDSPPPKIIFRQNISQSHRRENSNNLSPLSFSDTNTICSHSNQITNNLVPLALTWNCPIFTQMKSASPKPPNSFITPIENAPSLSPHAQICACRLLFYYCARSFHFPPFVFLIPTYIFFPCFFMARYRVAFRNSQLTLQRILRSRRMMAAGSRGPVWNVSICLFSRPF